MKNQLFIITPEKQLVINILTLYGIHGFDDIHYFTKEDLEELNTIQKLNEYIPELKKYYIPCKSKIYLENINIKRCITILRQLLKNYNYALISKEKNIKGKKYLTYKLSSIDTPIKKKKIKNKIIINFE